MNDDLYGDIRPDWQPGHGAAVALVALVACGLIVAITLGTLIYVASP